KETSQINWANTSNSVYLLDNNAQRLPLFSPSPIQETRQSEEKRAADNRCKCNNQNVQKRQAESHRSLFTRLTSTDSGRYCARGRSTTVHATTADTDLWGSLEAAEHRQWFVAIHDPTEADTSHCNKPLRRNINTRDSLDVRAAQQLLLVGFGQRLLVHERRF